MQDTIAALERKHIILGVTGSIACYKAVDLASKLTQAGAHVDVIMTDAAQRFVAPLTFQAVTGRAVYTDLWRADTGGGLPTHVAHVGLAEAADLLAVVPATADSLARLAQGRADDLLGVTALAARCPLLLAPAMDGSMYAHPAVQANVTTLQSRGAIIVEPEYGRFASGFEGQGRLPETPTLLGAIRMALGQSGALAGRTVLVTAGGTREPLDPVRYLTNRSSGRQGYALAQAALDAGARVILVSSAKGMPLPYGATLISVETAREMAALQTEFTLLGAPGTWKLAPNLDKARLVYKDLSYSDRLKKYCAKAGNITEAAYVDAEVNKPDAAFRSQWGFVPGPGLRAAYRQFLEKPGELIVEARPGGIDPRALQFYRPEDVLAQLNLQARVNGTAISDLSFMRQTASAPAVASVPASAERAFEPSPEKVVTPTAAHTVRGEYRAVRVGDLNKHIGKQVRISLPKGVVREGTLTEALPNLVTVARDYGRGDMKFEVLVKQVEKAEVRD